MGPDSSESQTIECSKNEAGKMARLNTGVTMSRCECVNKTDSWPSRIGKEGFLLPAVPLPLLILASRKQQSEGLPQPKTSPHMKLYAAGFNAWNQLALSADSPSDGEPQDVFTFRHVLGDDQQILGLPVSRLTYTIGMRRHIYANPRMHAEIQSQKSHRALVCARRAAGTPRTGRGFRLLSPALRMPWARV